MSGLELAVLQFPTRDRVGSLRIHLDSEGGIAILNHFRQSGFSVLNWLLTLMNPYSINPPESEVAFEKLCLALLKRHWSRPGLERFAKKGEEQFGVDIFDTFGESPMYGAQCKLKEQWKSLDPSEIRDEVNKAKTFPSKLDHYAILTTGKISGAAQLAIQAINQEHRAAGLFTVELFTWGKNH